MRPAAADREPSPDLRAEQPDRQIARPRARGEDDLRRRNDLVDLVQISHTPRDPYTRHLSIFHNERQCARKDDLGPAEPDELLGEQPRGHLGDRLLCAKRACAHPVGNLVSEPASESSRILLSVP